MYKVFFVLLVVVYGSHPVLAFQDELSFWKNMREICDRKFPCYTLNHDCMLSHMNCTLYQDHPFTLVFPNFPEREIPAVQLKEDSSPDQPISASLYWQQYRPKPKSTLVNKNVKNEAQLLHSLINYQNNGKIEGLVNADIIGRVKGAPKTAVTKPNFQFSLNEIPDARIKSKYRQSKEIPKTTNGEGGGTIVKPKIFQSFPSVPLPPKEIQPRLTVPQELPPPPTRVESSQVLAPKKSRTFDKIFGLVNTRYQPKPQEVKSIPEKAKTVDSSSNTKVKMDKSDRKKLAFTRSQTQFLINTIPSGILTESLHVVERCGLAHDVVHVIVDEISRNPLLDALRPVFNGDTELTEELMQVLLSFLAPEVSAELSMALSGCQLSEIISNSVVTEYFRKKQVEEDDSNGQKKISLSFLYNQG